MSCDRCRTVPDEVAGLFERIERNFRVLPTLRELRAAYAAAAFRSVNGNLSQGARVLGVSRETLRGWLRMAAA